MKQLCSLAHRELYRLCRRSFVLLVIYKIVIDWISLSRVSVVYAYAYGGATPNWVKYIISWMIYAVCIFILPYITNSNLKFAYSFFLVLSIVPSLMIFWLKDENSYALCGIGFFWIVYGLLSIFMSHTKQGTDKNETLRQYVPHSNNYVILAIFIFLVSSTLYFSYKYGDFRLFISFSDVYEYRMDTANYMSSIEAYIFSWNTNVLLPICLIVHLKDKNYLCALLDIMVGFASYSIYGNKTFVFQVMYVIGVWIIDRIDLKEITSNLITFLISILGIVGIVVSKSTVGSFIIFFFYRLLYIPAEAHYFYYDFFVNSEKLYFRQSILRRFFENPYEEIASIMIGTKYNKLGDYNNLNNGLFSDAYANLGVWGIIIYPVLMIIFLAIFTRCMKRYDTSFKNAIMIMLLMNFISTPLFQNLLTGGMLFAMVLFVLIRPKKI